MSIELGIPAAVYHDPAKGLSNSQISDLAESPFHFWSRHLAPSRPQRVATAAMNAGTLLHSLVLEPDTMTRYAVTPDDFDGRTKAGKDWKANAEAQGLSVVTGDMIATAEAQRAALMANPDIERILARGAAEASVFWTDEATGVPCRARPDWMTREGKRVTVLDLKTTSDASPAGFARSVATFGYHRQRAHYTAGIEAHGLKVDAFIFAAVSSSYPFVAMAYLLDEEAEAQGEEEVSELIALYAQCMRSGHWPAYGEGVTLLELPKWAKRSQEVTVSYA